jgi:hypothetical protein
MSHRLTIHGACELRKGNVAMGQDRGSSSTRSFPGGKMSCFQHVCGSLVSVRGLLLKIFTNIGWPVYLMMPTIAGCGKTILT